MTDFVAQFNALVSSQSAFLKSLVQLKDDRSPFSCGATIFAIIKSVTAGGMTSKSATIKTIQLSDPTANLDIESEDKLQLFPGHILKIENIGKIVTGNIVKYRCQGTTRLQQIPTFTFDFENRLPEIFDQRYFAISHHREACKILESWQAEKLLSWNFSKLSHVFSKTYLDFACEVIGQKTTKRNINLIVWDASKPSVQIQDQFRQDYADNRKEFGGTFQRMDESLLSLVGDRVAHICVWMNESYSSIDHFKTCMNIIPGRQAYLVFLNVEVSPIAGQGLAFSMRSGHHQGKGVRVVSPLSILGRLLSSRLDETIFDLQLEDIESTQPPAETATDNASTDALHGMTTPAEAVSSTRIEMLSQQPAHISRQYFVKEATLAELDGYEELLRNADPVNFDDPEFGVSLSPAERLEVLRLVKKSRSDHEVL